jgi:hypothetical protein
MAQAGLKPAPTGVRVYANCPCVNLSYDGPSWRCGSRCDVPACGRTHVTTCRPIHTSQYNEPPKITRPNNASPNTTDRPNNEPPYPYNVLTQIPSNVRNTNTLSSPEGRRSGRPKASNR